MQHKWRLDDQGKVDIFAVNEEYHNGPICTVCGYVECVFCNHHWKELNDCPGDFGSDEEEYF